MKSALPEMSIGAVSQRTGLSVSALRYYDEINLVSANRDSAGRRRFPRSSIRKLSLVMVLQRFGFTLSRIGDILSGLPQERAAHEADWRRVAQNMRQDIDERIATLEKLRDDLDGCIGCGCLSLKRCTLFNPQDKAATNGPGPRYLDGDNAADVIGG